MENVTLGESRKRIEISSESQDNVFPAKDVTDDGLRLSKISKQSKLGNY